MLHLLFLALLGALGASAAEPVWVAVGLGGRRLVSHDGLAWRELPSVSAAPLRALADDGKRLVAVGGAVLSTRDGEHWHTWPARAEELATIAGGKGRVVSMEGGRLLTAAGGEERFTKGEALPFTGAVRPRRSACGDTEAGFRFVFLGELETPAGLVPWRAVTEDGLHWAATARDAPPARSLAWGAGLFVIAGPQGLLETSHDGENWTRCELAAPDDVENLCWDGSRFIAQGKRLQTSADGFTWRLESLPAPGTLLWAGPLGRTLLWSWSQQLLAGEGDHWKPLPLSAAPAITAVCAHLAPGPSAKAASP